MAESAIAEKPSQALLVVLGVAVVCALLVSLAAVNLRPHYVANLEAYRLAQLESILTALSQTGLEVAPADIETRVVELASGRYAGKPDPATFDALKAANDPSTSIAISPDRDVAGIKRRAMHATVFLVRDAERNVALIILPVYGSGYQSTLRGFLALEGDTTKVGALRFYARRAQAGRCPGRGLAGLRGCGAHGRRHLRRDPYQPGRARAAALLAR
jgi:Na+-transporting NADH:ubiquinone oxidoreductase subunit C